MLGIQIPADLIATSPASERDRSRLLVYNRSLAQADHAHFSDLERWLVPGDLLVLNDTRVDPVRVAWRKPTGGASELVLLKALSEKDDSSLWEAMVSGRGLSPAVPYELPGGMTFQIASRGEGSLVRVELSANKAGVQAWLREVGAPPLPPYIRKARKRSGMPEDVKEDRNRYQTVFAERPGAVAAPTAGLHFTPELIERLSNKGIRFAYVTLAVGWGTFEPLTEEHLMTGKLHTEAVNVPSATVAAIAKAKSEGGRVVAVGTTVVRSLEWWKEKGSPTEGISGDCELFIRPPWKSDVVDALITNFHLPESSLIYLVAAFLGDADGKKVEKLYTEAIDKRYRFYSYGDAMLIL